MFTDIAPLIGPGLALLIIFRRGTKPRRVKVNSLWTYPLILTVLAGLALSRSHAPGLIAIASYAAALLVGGALGWFTAQHSELTLDKNNGTVMSQPTMIGTVITAAAFLIKFGIDYYVNGGAGNGTPHPFAVQHAAGINVFGNAMLVFAVARTLGGAAHMWIRTRPLVAELAAHKASLPPKGS
jgi:hypothetical protein